MAVPDKEMSATWKWARRFMQIARNIASWSKDPSTKVGAVAIGSAKQILAEGYNGIPRGVKDLPERYERPAKYDYIVHAEANVVAHAARSVLAGSTVYVTHLCCSQCAALLINAGVKTVITDKNAKTSMPPEKFEIARQMFREAGVQLFEENFAEEDITNGIEHNQRS
jgi:dCMP deaminase